MTGFASSVHVAFGKFVVKRWRFRQLLSSLAEWCIAYGVKRGKRRAAGVSSRITALFLPPPFFFPLSRSAVRTIPPGTQ